MSTVDYETFDVSVLQVNEPVIVSSEYALKDVVPIKWDDSVISGNIKVLLVEDGEH